MSQPLSSHTYLQIARTLPRPSEAQCKQFLQHIATAPRWFRLLPLDGGVPCTLFLNPHAGRELARASAGSVAFRDRDAAPGRAASALSTAQYREAFGYLDYAVPGAQTGALLGADLGLPQPNAYYVLDADGRAAPLPPDLLKAATCSLNATVYPDAAALIETLPLRVPSPPLALDLTEQLAPISADAELRIFAEEYVCEELAGFQCPDDREAWELRQIEAFRHLHTPRRAEQLARLRSALDGLLTWIYGR